MYDGVQMYRGHADEWGVYRCIGHTDVWGMCWGHTDVWGHTRCIDVCGGIDVQGLYRCMGVYKCMEECTDV